MNEEKKMIRNAKKIIERALSSDNLTYRMALNYFLSHSSGTSMNSDIRRGMRVEARLMRAGNILSKFGWHYKVDAGEVKLFKLSVA